MGFLCTAHTPTCLDDFGKLLETSAFHRRLRPRRAERETEKFIDRKIFLSLNFSVSRLLFLCGCSSAALRPSLRLNLRASLVAIGLPKLLLSPHTVLPQKPPTPAHASRITHHASRITFHVSHFTPPASPCATECFAHTRAPTSGWSLRRAVCPAVAGRWGVSWVEGW
jgi:hypothetical protein